MSVKQDQDNVRRHGSPPYQVAVIHGGPGAAGDVGPVAHTLAAGGMGVLEPLQTALSVQGQIAELEDVLTTHGQCPVILVGHSWGAWLALLTAADAPQCVRKLILIGAAPFEVRYAAHIDEARMGRLRPEEAERVNALTQDLADAATPDQDILFGQLGALLSKADSFAPMPRSKTNHRFRYDQFKHVWPEAAALRANGELLVRVRQIRCPVTAIHGGYDPHPAAGVQQPLSKVLPDFHFILLERCGHNPWAERYARDRFYQILKTEIGNSL